MEYVLGRRLGFVENKSRFVHFDTCYPYYLHGSVPQSLMFRKKISKYLQKNTYEITGFSYRHNDPFRVLCAFVSPRNFTLLFDSEIRVWANEPLFVQCFRFSGKSTPKSRRSKRRRFFRENARLLVRHPGKKDIGKNRKFSAKEILFPTRVQFNFHFYFRMLIDL